MKSQKRILFKPRLTIANIGVVPFWKGVFLGLFSAFVFYFFTFYLVDFMMVFNVSMNGDLQPKTENISFFETSFLTATSLCLGITMMIRHWFMQPSFHFVRSYKNISLRISNFSLFIFYLALYAAVVYVRFFCLENLLLACINQ